MNKEIELLFKTNNGSFDTEEPEMGHRDRFLARLEAEQGIVNIHGRRRLWLKPLAIAASVAVLIAVGIAMYLSPPLSIDEQVANISPEVANTEYYFASLIEEQVRDLQKESTPETQQLIGDTMNQLQKLETNYKGLERDLLDGGNSKLILSAMITNFQTRIDLLREVLDKIATIKNLKLQNDANFTI